MRVLRLKEAYPTAKVELWCEDEHRLGLKPIVRKVWSPTGQRPLVEAHQRYEWTYLYAFARPKSGEVHWLILPTVNARVFSSALEHFAREVGAGTRRRILLERVMNLGENRIGMRILRLACSPAVPRFPHS